MGTVHMHRRHQLLLPAAFLLLTGGATAADGDGGGSSLNVQTYLDGGYAASNRDAANPAWPGKSTTNVLNSPELFLGMVNLSSEATSESRWGFEFGLQAGRDSEGLVTSAPPPANEPIDNADTWRHLYRANIAYRFGGERGMRLTGGLINSYIGYESFLAIDNPNYTRGYILDNVPYFLVGLEALWNLNDDVDLALYLIDSYNYLTNANDALSTGAQVKWRINPNTTFIQNLYYGPDQANTDVEFWRFLSDSIIEWKHDRWLLAAALDYGREKQADLATQPTARWWSAAVWTRWNLTERTSIAFRPEVYSDRDGLITGSPQTLTAYTLTLKYERDFGRQRLAGALELRYDESDLPGGAFPDGPNDQLEPDQTILLAGLQWSFGQ